MNPLLSPRGGSRLSECVSASPSCQAVENGEKAQLSASLLLFQKPPLPAGWQAFGFGEEGIEERTRQHGEEDGPWSVDAVWAWLLLCVLREPLTLPEPEKWNPVSPTLWDL